MFFPKVLKNLSQLLLTSVIIFSSTVTLAGKDGVSGGGIAAGDDLLDFKEATDGTGRVPFVPGKLEAIRTQLGLILNRVKTGDVSFAARLSDTIFSARKTWYFQSVPLKNQLPTKNLHILLDDKTHEVIAIQDQTSITVYKVWFENKLKGDYFSKLRAVGLIIHEAIMDTVLTYGMDHNIVRELVRIIFADELGGQFPAANFLKILKEKGFYPSLIENKRAQANGLLQKAERISALINKGDFMSSAWTDEYDYYSTSVSLKVIDWELDAEMAIAFRGLFNVVSRATNPSTRESAIRHLEEIKNDLRNYPPAE